MVTPSAGTVILVRFPFSDLAMSLGVFERMTSFAALAPFA